jgi:hypothetical protein
LNLTKDKELELDENIKSLKRKIRAVKIVYSKYYIQLIVLFRNNSSIAD